MSYECDQCGKGSVDKPGDWCNECQQKAQWEYEEDQAQWFSSSAKCQQCSNAWGPDPGDHCSAYKMPLYMVKRKKKCKRFTEIDWSLETYDNF